LVVGLSILCLIWRFIVLVIFGVRQSIQLKFLIFSTIAEIVFASARLILLYVDPPEPNIYLYQEPVLSVLLRLCWFSFQVLTFISIIGYFTEKISVEKTLSMAERKRISGLQDELVLINSLLLEKEQLLKELSQEKVKSETANRAKGQFLANVSHEIRTPLHGLIGLTSIIMKSSMSEEIRNSLNKILYSSKALLLILNEILDFSKIEAGVIEIHQEPFKINHLMEDIHDLYSIPASEKGIELRFDIDPAIPEVMIGDFYKLRQVLFNLVGNSIKFTQQGFVEVQVKLNQSEELSVCVTMMVRDSGIGISEKDLKVIFEPFNQIDNTNSRRYDGVGLGLPISQNILWKMGSELVMTSQQGIGTESRFELRLRVNDRIPYKHRSLNASSQKDESSLVYASLVGRRVLVAEDNLINIEVVRQYLTFLKIESDYVMDGQQCIEALKKNSYDCVLMDIQMPQLDGLQATYQIRLMPELKDLPIIGLSAGVAQSDRERGIDSGMNDFLAKPFEFEELAKILRKFLG
jgi:two-component system, sensor histidine kinase